MGNGHKIREQIVYHMKVQFNLPDEQIDAMIPTFIQTLNEHLSALEQAVVSGSLEDVGRVAHMLKGALLNLGLEQCAETALSIEKDAKAGEYHRDYRALCEELRASLREFLALSVPGSPP